MVEQGSLKDFGLAEILEQIYQQRQSGVLHCLRRRQAIHLDFVEGMVVNVVEEPSPSTGSLGEMLLAIGQISGEELEQAIEEQRRTLAPLGKILIDFFGLDVLLIQTMLRIQALESLYSLFFWDSGDYQFESSLVEAPPNAYEPINPEYLLEEGFALADEWPRIQRRLRSMEATFHRLRETLPRSLGSFTFDPLEQQFFELVQEGITFQQLSLLSGLGQFETGRILVKLLDAQAIQLHKAPSTAGRNFSRMIFGGTPLRFAVWALVNLLVVGVVTFVLAFARYSPVRLLGHQTFYTVPPPQLHRALAQWRQRRIERALEVFRLSEGHYPRTLQQLSKGHWIPASWLHYPGRGVFFYRRIGLERYQLLPPLQGRNTQNKTGGL